MGFRKEMRLIEELQSILAIPEKNQWNALLADFISRVNEPSRGLGEEATEEESIRGVVWLLNALFQEDDAELQESLLRMINSLVWATGVGPKINWERLASHLSQFPLVALVYVFEIVSSSGETKYVDLIEPYISHPHPGIAIAAFDAVDALTGAMKQADPVERKKLLKTREEIRVRFKQWSGLEAT